MTDKEKTIKELKEALDGLDITNKYRLNIIRAIEYIQEEPVSEEWIEELTTKLDSMSKEDFKKVFDKYAVDFNEEPVSEELEEAASWYAKEEYDRKNPATLTDRCRGCYAPLMYAFKAGAKWQKEQFEKDYTNLCKGIATAKGLAVAMAYDKGVADTKEQMVKNIWKPADGDELPEIDREVVVLIKYNAQRNIHDEEYPTYRVGFGHRPNPNGWDGKNIETNEATHYTPKLYDKGGWNAPNIVYWLDVELPKEIEL